MSVKIIGIGDNGQASLPLLYQLFVRQSEYLIGGERHLAFFPEYSGEKRLLNGDLPALVRELATETRNVVVLASGDPLFYGIGTYLSERIAVEVYPNVSSVQLAFAKAGLSWQNAVIVSLHGRHIQGLAQKVDGHEIIAMLTDQTNTPAIIADYLLEYGITEYRAFVAENLGGAAERFAWFSLEELTTERFSALNVVILKQTAPGPFWPIGIDEEQFCRRPDQTGLITKKEARLLSLHALRLRPNSIAWDIGTCTGAVAIEMAKIARYGEVFAIEKNIEDLDNCRQNMLRFRTDFTAIHGRAPDGLDTFKDPDAVFIGGTAGNMEQILALVNRRLRKHGRIVLNVATIENLGAALRCLSNLGFENEVTLLQISRTKPILQLTRFDALNPVFIIAAGRRGEN